jgi:regulatory protein
MTRQRPRRSPRPLDGKRLDELALRYAGRYATTRAKLISYLQRKLRERGWDGDQPPELERIATRFAELGYVDDRAFALAKESAHTARGLGRRRLSIALRSAGVGEEDGADALALSASRSLDSALRLAERRRLGPFAVEPPASPRDREKAIAALLRGGHGFDVARAIIALAPGDEEGLAELRERYSDDRE